MEVQIWTTSASITEWLGINFNDFTISSTDAGETINFGTVGGSEFATLFGSAGAGTVDFNVSAGNGLTSGSNSLETTVATTVTSPGSGLTNTAISAAVSALNTSIGSISNGANTAPGSPLYTDMCYSGVNPCVGPTLGSQGYGFISKAGDKYGGNLPYSASGTAGGASLEMFDLTQNGTKSGTSPTVSAAYAGVWALSSTGDLTYTVPSQTVPLPAAAWLLGSGILGLAGIARRRRVTVAA
ncbi:MAG: VPLPA-CTERM sorting domain-containing protein [Steroidobacteraceae bacterium]